MLSVQSSASLSLIPFMLFMVFDVRRSAFRSSALNTETCSPLPHASLTRACARRLEPAACQVIATQLQGDG